MKQNTRGRYFTFILYPDNEIHMEVFRLIQTEYFQKLYDFTWCGMHHQPDAEAEYKEHLHIALAFKDVWTIAGVKRLLTSVGGCNQVFQLFTKDNHIKARELERAYEKVLDENGNTVMIEKDGKQVPKMQKGKLCRRDKKDDWKTYLPVLKSDGTPVYAPIDYSNTVQGHQERICTFVPEKWYEELDKFKNYVDSTGETLPVGKDKIWRKVDFWAVNHVEVVSNMRAMLIYFMHKDSQSIKNGKPMYSHTDFLGDKKLAHAILTGNNPGSDSDVHVKKLLDMMGTVDTVSDLLAYALSNGDGELVQFISGHAYLIMAMLKDHKTSRFHSAWVSSRHAQKKNCLKVETYEKVDISEKEEEVPAIPAWDADNLVPSGRFVMPEHEPDAIPVPDAPVEDAPAPVAPEEDTPEEKETLENLFKDLISRWDAEREQKVSEWQSDALEAGNYFKDLWRDETDEE